MQHLYAPPHYYNIATRPIINPASPPAPATKPCGAPAVEDVEAGALDEPPAALPDALLDALVDALLVVAGLVVAALVVAGLVVAGLVVAGLDEEEAPEVDVVIDVMAVVVLTTVDLLDPLVTVELTGPVDV